MDETSIEVFDNQQFGHLRVTMSDGEPWFVAKDVCDALGIQTNHVREILDDDEVSNLPITEVGPEQGGRVPLVVSEAGMYALVLKSRKPEAQAFRRWVTHEVLPSIRSHGMYATAETVEDMLRDPQTMIRTLQTLQAERERSASLMEDNARMLPKSVAYDLTMSADKTMSVTDSARYLSQMDRRITRRWLFAHLRADNLICKQSRMPTKYATDHGYAVQQMPSPLPDGRVPEPYARLTRKGIDWCIRNYVAQSLVVGGGVAGGSKGVGRLLADDDDRCADGVRA